MTKLYNSIINNIEMFGTTPSSTSGYSNYVMYGPYIGKDIPILSKNIVIGNDNSIIYLVDDGYLKVVISNQNDSTNKNYYKGENDRSLYNNIKNPNLPDINVSVFLNSDDLPEQSLIKNGFIYYGTNKYLVKEIGSNGPIKVTTTKIEPSSSPITTQSEKLNTDNNANSSSSPITTQSQKLKTDNNDNSSSSKTSNSLLVSSPKLICSNIDKENSLTSTTIIIIVVIIIIVILIILVIIYFIIIKKKIKNLEN